MDAATDLRDGTDDQTALQQTSLPVIDISGLSGDDEQSRQQIAAEPGEAARTSGFFHISGHGVPQDIIDKLFAASKQFHEMPRQYRMRYRSGFSTNHRGYVPFEENGFDFLVKINYN